MPTRYRHYIQANPLQGWALQVVILLVFSRILTWLLPDSDKSGFHSSSFFICAFIAVTQPTIFLWKRLSEEGRRDNPLSPIQERNIGRLSLAAALCGLGALAAGLLSRWAGWPYSIRVDWLLASFFAVLIAASLGFGVRRTRMGWWGVRLSSSWAVLLVIYVLAMLLWRASGHSSV